MRFSRWVVPTVLAMLALSSAGVLAQGRALGRGRGPMPESGRGPMEVTDRRIELAETVVSASEDAPARDELALARALQGRARSAAGSGRLREAALLTGQALGHADRAIVLGRGLPTQERLRAQWDRTGELLEWSGPRIRDCGDERARALLRAAVEMQQRARSADQAGRSLGALQLTMGARARCLQALRLCRIEENAQQAAERALGRTDEVLALARERLESGASGIAARPRVRDALARAAAMQEDASRQLRDGHLEASLELTLTARRLAHRIAGLGPQPR
jgi:hypothetical protein